MIQIEIDQRQIKRIEKILAGVDDKVAIAAYDKGLKAAGNVVATRARAKAPRGDRSKQSAKARNRWSPIPLAKLIRVKVIGRGVRQGSKKTPMALVGAKYPEGNQIHFVHPHAGKDGGGKATKEQVFWGKGRQTKPKENDFLKRAFDHSKSEQVRAFTRALIPEIRRQLGRAVRGRP